MTDTLEKSAVSPSIPRPFALDVHYKDPIRRALLAMLGRPIEHLFGLDALNDVYARILLEEPANGFIDNALKTLGISYDVRPADLEKVPKTGGLVVVANHPYGGIDGLILASMLRRVRPDVKILANFLLGRIPELREHMLFVDVFGGKESARSNAKALRAALEHVQNGGVLAVFPAGEVSHIDLKKRAIIDSKWSDTVARIVRKAKTPVLPVFFHGANSAMFNALGLIHPMLRTAMLPRELLNKEHSRIAMEVGTVISNKKLAGFESDVDLTNYLRLRTYILQTRRPDQVQPASHRKTAPMKLQEIAAPQDAGVLLDEITSLPPDTLLIDQGEYVIHAATAQQIPHVLLEIGRLREITFRGVNEGTGLPRDIDRFDEDYVHLFCWHKTKAQLVGAYRLGQTDVIVAKRGIDGLYTRTLFNYDAKLVEQISPAIEMGRSFVRPEYQRSFSPLMLLWKGIGQFVVKNPKYMVLFGPVSINNQYQSISQQLIMTFLKATSGSHLAGLIRAKNPPKIAPIRSEYIREYSTVVRDIDEVDDLVAEIESDRKGVPILLKQYMKLSARFLGFNVDPDFGDVLDGLMLVDLRQIDPKLVEKFAGKEGAAVLLRNYQRSN